MDEIVRKAMAKWPRVPAVFGWLALDRRGRWRVQGEPIRHAASVAFINRNYDVDTLGRWFFQNGPQRVFVDLDYTPWVYLLDGAGALHAHTGQPVQQLSGAWLDDLGGLLLRSELGVGVVHDHDLSVLSEAFTTHSGAPCDDELLETVFVDPSAPARDGIRLRWRNRLVPVGLIESSRVAERFSFDPRPREDRECAQAR